MTELRTQLFARLDSHVPGYGLYAFRILFGLTLIYSLGRFWYYGWVEQFFIKPSFHFKYWGFAWIPDLSPVMVYGLFTVLTLLAVFITLGIFYRISAVLFFFGFSFLQLLDAANYLNHYYLVVLISFLMVFLPLDAGYSWNKRTPQSVPLWTYAILRFQFGVVYFYAGLAKLNADWLLSAQPMNIWMSARTDTPLIGEFLKFSWSHYAMSWAGFLFDTTIVLWLCLGKTRKIAFLTLVVFHWVTGYFFSIGLFPLIMVVGAATFFPPNWPEQIFKSMPNLFKITGPYLSPQRAQYLPDLKNSGLLRAAMLGWICFHLFMPLRHFIYKDPVTWTEQGMRFSWKVMVREKNGSVTFRVRNKATGREWQVSPRSYLSIDQEREMSGQPELILQLAKHIGSEFNKKGRGPVAVYADALVAWNGRPRARFIDPEVDLLQVEEGFWQKPWVLPPPNLKPILLGANQ